MKIIKYYKHNFSRPIYMDGYKLLRGFVFVKYQNGDIYINDVLVNKKIKKSKPKQVEPKIKNDNDKKKSKK